MTGDWRQARRLLTLIGVTGVVLSAFGAAANPTQFAVAWLTHWLFWLGITLGSLALAMLHHLTGGRWGRVLEPVLAAATRTLPMLFILALPLLFYLHELYPWTRAGVIAESEILQKKVAYLNLTAFLVRVAVYFVIWQVLVSVFNRWHADPVANAGPLKRLAAGGGILYGLTATFAGFDLLMSLQPEWYSSIFGLLVIVSQMLSATAFGVAAVHVLNRDSRYAPSAREYNDYGNLLLTFIMVWAYLAFMQYLIIWYENLPHEIAWYLPRRENSWQWVAFFLFGLHFALPFVILLSRAAKRSGRRLAAVALLLIAAHLLYLYWLVAPPLRPDRMLHWLDLTVFLGIGGLWLALFLHHYEHGPRLEQERAEEAPAHG